MTPVEKHRKVIRLCRREIDFTCELRVLNVWGMCKRYAKIGVNGAAGSATKGKVIDSDGHCGDCLERV